MKSHLAIFSKLATEAIFSGVKTTELRFSQSRIAPFGQIDTGDIVYMKLPGEEIIGQFKVKKVISIQGMDTKDIEDIRQTYGSQVSFGDEAKDKEFFQKHQNAKFATILFIGLIERFITPPIKIPKKDLRGWVVLD